FLKYAIDRGWIAPLVRSLLAIAAGVGVAAWGEARIRGGLRRYGAAMIGAGGGLVYLGLWAAAGPYGLLERRIGVLLLAACTVAVTLLALRHEIEGLAIWALAGAYMAPILLSPHVPNPEAFLGYLEVIGLGTGLLAWVPLSVALAGVRNGPEARLWLAVGAPFAIAGLLWWQQLEQSRLGAPLEAVLFGANPFVLLALVWTADPALRDRAPALLPALLAAPYLGVGWARRAAPHLVMGFALGALAVAMQGSPPTVVIGWTALVLAGLAAEQQGGRPGGRLAALGLALLGFPYLFGVALWDRPSVAAPFTDPWALALYGYLAGAPLAPCPRGTRTAPAPKGL